MDEDLHPPTPLPPVPITVTTEMWEYMVQRLVQAEQRASQAEGRVAQVEQAHDELERAVATALLTQAKGETIKRSGPKIEPPPMFGGDRKELLPFLSKCRLKFQMTAADFPTEKDKVMYAGSRLEGTPFAWSDPLLTAYPEAGEKKPIPPELASFEAFATALTRIYGDPNMAATATREIKRLRQTGSVTDYAIKFESKKPYVKWNDGAFCDQFYDNLKDEIKDEMAPLGKPETLEDMKALAIKIDTRLYERRLEKGPSNPTRPTPARPMATPAHPAIPNSHATQQTTATPRYTNPTPTGGLRIPSYTPDGTVPMELGARGWQLTEQEKQRRRGLGLCIYCASDEHKVEHCPTRPPPRSSSRVVATFETTPASQQSGNDNTQE